MTPNTRHIGLSEKAFTFSSHDGCHELDELHGDHDGGLGHGVLAAVVILDAVVGGLLGHLAEDLEGHDGDCEAGEPALDLFARGRGRRRVCGRCLVDWKGVLGAGGAEQGLGGAEIESVHGFTFC